MRRAGFTAAAAMGWLRVVRPGSVIGPQQNYLADFDAGRRRWAGLRPVLVTEACTSPRSCSGGAAGAVQAAGGGGGRRAAAAAAAGSGELARQVTLGMAHRGQFRAAAAAAATTTTSSSSSSSSAAATVAASPAAVRVGRTGDRRAPPLPASHTAPRAAGLGPQRWSMGAIGGSCRSLPALERGSAGTPASGPGGALTPGGMRTLHRIVGCGGAGAAGAAGAPTAAARGIGEARREGLAAVPTARAWRVRAGAGAAGRLGGALEGLAAPC
jgi:hypothetical protein